MQLIVGAAMMIILLVMIRIAIAMLNMTMILTHLNIFFLFLKGEKTKKEPTNATYRRILYIYKNTFST